tara:strand:+ start:1085 stop:1948 length:864 start_codon:yes stop_codon:yes gene_type:complete
MRYGAPSILSLQVACREYGNKIYNQRTEENTKTLFNTMLGYEFSVVNSLNENYYVMPEGRALRPHVAAAELAWTLMGVKDISFLQQYSKMWDKFTNDNNEVEAAYGYRWKKHFGRDQLFDALDQLKKNRSSRQIVISAWDPETDGLKNEGKIKNVPCPMSFQLNIDQNEKLYLTLFMRSSDVVVGLPYDFMFYDQLAVAIANELKIKKTEITIFSANTHLYRKHQTIVTDQLLYQEECMKVKYYSSDLTLSDIAQYPEDYVEEVKFETLNDVEQRKYLYDPKPEVFE